MIPVNPGTVAHALAVRNGMPVTHGAPESTALILIRDDGSLSARDDTTIPLPNGTAELLRQFSDNGLFAESCQS